jgi:hypothetical protein
MTSSEAILSDLRKTFGRKTVLYSEDLADLLGSDHRVVTSLLKGMAIPLKIKKVGNRWGVSIYEVADWLAEPDPPKKQQQAVIPKRLQPPARTRTALGRSLLALKTQRNFLNELIVDLDIWLSNWPSRHAESSSPNTKAVRTKK